MSEKLLIFGNQEQAEVCHYYFKNHSGYDVIAFIVDSQYIAEENFCGLPVIATENLQTDFSPEDYSVFVAIGYSDLNRVRELKYEQFKRLGYKLASYVSERAIILNEYNIGDNCLLLENNTVQPFVQIGNNVTIWSGNHIGHHSRIGDNAFITSHVVISGGVSIGNNTFIGVNSTIRDHIAIGQNNLIGAGSLIMKSTKENEIYVPERTEPRNKL